MGEIRSTLDLIMERTKNLSLTPAEKTKIQQQEWLGKARGWVQRYLDEAIGLDGLKSAWAELGDSAGAVDELRREIIAAVDPETDQQRRWDVLEVLWRIPRKALEETLGRCRETLALEKGQRAAALLRTLEELRVSGTAVVPNVNSDPEWAALRAAAVQECVGSLQQIR